MAKTGGSTERTAKTGGSAKRGRRRQEVPQRGRRRQSLKTIRRQFLGHNYIEKQVEILKGKLKDVNARDRQRIKYINRLNMT